ncbi:hypothetical protein KKJ09_19395 [Xenorhabdus bovienii]|uniref:hypothetical protein n=1 Tax=Xenorhabdus bovienii TaxID=40576 RepID=UPI0023B31A43|nr:hypothetical protein [Xenorhabdus bovienii]MDE9495687.1 hypothetical protein [Xenorhabdus bovienii]MDE9504073.1 hypothetical protein [Xenorhabdus bovienii]MDE9528175.1 hypothetical protein [Xenorhabdus bovienii]MDE9571199.1 hypothetical protein [Xenorhabdus bovienii]
MGNRLEILKNSLSKKEDMFNQRLQSHFDTVKQANGQPLNDKRNGRATLNKWDRQNDQLRNIDRSIQRTKSAIEREEAKIALAESVDIPKYIKTAINDGLITQWRKFPRFFFVNGVKHGRIVLDVETGLIAHRYLSKVTREEFPIFKRVFNQLNQQSRE